MKNSKVKKSISLKIIFISALIIRLFIMPFFTHIDFYNSISRTVNLIEGNIGYLSYETFLFAIGLGLGYKFVLPFIEFLRIHPWDWTTESLKQITSLDSIYYVNFFGKLPFLFLEIGIVYFIYQLFKQDKSKLKKILILYLFNPIIIYVVYFIGRYEVYQFLFIFAGLYFFKKERYPLSFFFIGCATHVRLYPILILPFIFFAVKKSYLKRIYYCLFFAIPVIAKKLLTYSLPKTDIYLQRFQENLSGASINPISSILKSGHIYFILNPKIFGIPVILLFSIIIFLLYLKCKNKNINSVIDFISMFFLMFYGLGGLEPQYYAWGIPFIILSLCSKRHLSIFWTLYFILNLSMIIDFGKAATTYLAMPINMEFFYSLPSIEKIFIYIFGNTGFKVYQLLFRVLCFYTLFNILIKYYPLTFIKKIVHKINSFINNFIVSFFKNKLIIIVCFIIVILITPLFLNTQTLKKLVIMPYYPFIENYNSHIRFSSFKNNYMEISFIANKPKMHGFLLFLRGHNEKINFKVLDKNRNILYKTERIIDFNTKIYKIYFKDYVELEKEQEYIFRISPNNKNSSALVGWNSEFNNKNIGEIIIPEKQGYIYFKPMYLLKF